MAAALRAGVDLIEHGMFLDDAAIELFLRTGARLSPPSWLLRDPGRAERARLDQDRARPAAEAQVRSFRAAVEAGVKVVAGTDAGTPDNPHGGVAREVAFMVDAGLPSSRPSGRPPPRPPTSSAWPTVASSARAPPPTSWSSPATWPPA